jgi:hypothetical protein
MAFSGNFMCTSFKQQILEAVHDFRGGGGGDSFYCALYDNSANFTANTTTYTSVNEVPNSGSYVAGGGLLVNVSPTTNAPVGTTAFPSFTNFSWTSATINAYGAMIYNSTPTHTYTNPSVVILDFGGPKSSVSGTFQIVFPAATASTAIIRIA